MSRLMLLGVGASGAGGGGGAPETFFILQEDGSKILQEDGSSRILIEH